MRTDRQPGPEDRPEAPHLPTLSREMLHEQVYSVLKRNLMIGRFVPGQRLPLRGLAQTLGTSLMPVRDALQRLESMGCVVSTPTRTMMVPVFTDKELLDIRHLRLVLESAATERAVLNRTEGQLDHLRRHCADIGRSAQTDDVDLFLEANFHFHMTVAAMSQLAFIQHLLEPLWLHMGPAVRQSIPTKALFESAARNHQDALDAIERRDREGALAAIRLDINEGYLP